MENVKIAVAIRSARTALGWNQQEFADKMNVAKSTIARIETLEMTAKADFLTRALRLFRDAGVTIDLLQEEQVALVVEAAGLFEAELRLQNEGMRRRDRKPKEQVNVLSGPRAYAVEVKPKRGTKG